MAPQLGFPVVHQFLDNPQPVSSWAARPEGSSIWGTVGATTWPSGTTPAGPVLLISSQQVPKEQHLSGQPVVSRRGLCC